MSTTTNMSAPPYQQFVYPPSPYTYEPPNEVITLLQNQSLAQATSDAATRQAASDIARDILRAVDNNGAVGTSTTERVNSQLASAVERNGAQGMHATERASNIVNTAVERNGGNIMTAIERVAGEGRLTTTVVDAASRQASADSARDISVSVERNGANSVNAVNQTHSALLSAIERNAGENRMTTVTMSGQTDTRMTDVRHAVIGEVNRSTNELLSTLRANNESLSTAIQNGAWENRTAMASGFAASMLEANKSAALMSTQSSDHYASLLLEQQKLGQFFGSKADSHFAMNQLELQKVKEGLACQAAQNFSISQLENQKIRESITLQLADAKYEALKSTTFLADKIAECCCKTGDKIDNIDRDRLRDSLTVERTDNNLLKVLELTDLLDGRRGGHHHGRGRRGHN